MSHAYIHEVHIDFMAACYLQVRLLCVLGFKQKIENARATAPTLLNLQAQSRRCDPIVQSLLPGKACQRELVDVAL